MLVLTRKIGQQIVLPGCGITIDIVGVTKSQVRLGIEAPSDVAVYRSEILDRIHRPAKASRQGRPRLKISSIARSSGGPAAVCRSAFMLATANLVNV